MDKIVIFVIDCMDQVLSKPQLPDLSKYQAFYSEMVLTNKVTSMVRLSLVTVFFTDSMVDEKEIEVALEAMAERLGMAYLGHTVIQGVS